MEYKIIKNEDIFKAECEKYAVDFPSGDVSVLRSRVKIGNKYAPNSIVYQAMEGCDGKSDGTPDELTKRRYLRFAKGGAGVIWFEATAVMQSGRANPRQLYIQKSTVSDFQRIVEDIKETCLKANGFEPLVICQLTYSGRYSKPHGVPEPKAAYDCPPLQNGINIHILSDGELDEICEALINATALARSAGFDGADIKSCHRYLLSELLSAYTRPGKYGGSFENRTRLLLTAVKQAKLLNPKDFIITSRLNTYDGIAYPMGFGMKQDGSLEPDFTESELLTEKLCDNGIDMINVTMGNPYFNPHVNRPFAKGGYIPPQSPLKGVKLMLDGACEIKRACKEIPVVCSALSYLGSESAKTAAGYIQNGGFELAGWGRMTLAYPSLAHDICTSGELDKAKLCLTCGKCSEIMRAGGRPGCVVRDSEVYAQEYKSYIGEKGMKE